MNLRYLILFTIVIGITSLSAQTVDDALRMSDLNIGSTARSAGVAGSMNAIGGDYSALSINPAGLATYRSGQIMLTTGYSITDASSNLLGGDRGSINDNIGRLNINNAGIIWANRPQEVYEDENGEYYNVSNWKTSNFTLGMNRLANLNANYSFSGTSSGSIGDQFLYTATTGNGREDAFGDILAYNVRLLDDFQDANGTFLGHDVEGYDVFKSQSIKRRGSINEIILGWAGNYNEKILIGANVGIPFVKYTEEKIYTETDPEDLIPFFNNTRYDENLEMTGAGFNVKLGAIYMPTRKLRLGLSLHTPTLYQFDEEYTTSLTYDRTIDNNNEIETDESPIGDSQYRIQTPWRLSSGLAFIFGRNGFLSADIEYVNYAGTNYDLDIDFEDPDNDLFEQDLNAEIDDFAKSVLNIRLGAEVAIKGIRLRAGYGILGQQLDLDLPNRQLMSVGIGHAFNSFYIDIAAQRLTNEIQYSPYANPEARQDVDIDVSQYKALLTFGVRI